MFIPASIFGLALAQEPALDLSRAYVISGSERLAMGGAGIALASGLGGGALVPGAHARRGGGPWRSTVPALTARLGVLGFKGSDLPNLGGPSFRGATGALGVGLLRGRFGVGAVATASAVRPEEVDDQRVEEGELRLTLAVSGPRGRVLAGAGALVLTGQATRPGASLGWTAAAPTAGLVLDLPEHGLSVAATVVAPAVDGNVAGGLEVERAVMPAQGAVGVAWASVVGPTPLRRHPTRVAADLHVLGPVAGGRSPEAWTLGLDRARGQAVSLSPRLGAETEIWPGRLRLRAGSYLEPARNEGGQARVHGTGGIEVRVASLKVAGRRWSLSYKSAVDLSRSYAQVQLIGLGFWRAAGPPRSPRPG